MLLSSLSVVLQERALLEVTLDLLSSIVILLKEGVPCLRKWSTTSAPSSGLIKGSSPILGLEGMAGSAGGRRERKREELDLVEGGPLCF